MSGRIDKLLARVFELQGVRMEEERRDRTKAPAFRKALMALPPETRLEMARHLPLFASPALGTLLLDEAEEELAAKPAEAAALADLALAIGRQLAAGGRDTSEAQALLRRAWSLEGEACRRRGDLPGARRAHGQAFSYLVDWPAGGAEGADYCRYLALLRRDQGREDEGLALAAWALERFESLEDRRRAQDCRLALAWMRLDDLDAQAAADLFEPAMAGSEAEAWLSARHGLALACADLGRDARARALLAEIAGAAGDHGVGSLRLKLVEASVLQRLGENEEAAELLFAAWSGYALAGEPYAAVLALLDLAALRAEEGSTGDLERLRQGLQSLRGLGENVREAVLAGLALAQERGPAGVEQLEALKPYVRRARYDPEVSFPPLGLKREEEPSPAESERPAEGKEGA